MYKGCSATHTPLCTYTHDHRRDVLHCVLCRLCHTQGTSGHTQPVHTSNEHVHTHVCTHTHVRTCTHTHTHLIKQTLGKGPRFPRRPYSPIDYKKRWHSTTKEGWREEEEEEEEGGGGGGRRRRRRRREEGGGGRRREERQKGVGRPIQWYIGPFELADSSLGVVHWVLARIWRISGAQTWRNM